MHPGPGDVPVNIKFALFSLCSMLSPGPVLVHSASHFSIFTAEVFGLYRLYVAAELRLANRSRVYCGLDLF